VPPTFQPGSTHYRTSPAVPYDYNRNYNTNYQGDKFAPPAKTRAPLTTELPQRTWTFRPVSVAGERSAAPARLEPTTNTDDASLWRAAKRS
jgi:hypothetical protein